MPQLARSVSRFWQTPPHIAYGATHVHTDPTHAPPTPQFRPHTPQLAESVAVSGHLPPGQLVRPVPQLVHKPPAHAPPTPQLRLHVPQ